jgi:hypothetical protein
VWAKFTRDFESESDFKEELASLEALFGYRWTRAGYMRVTPPGGPL